MAFTPLVPGTLNVTIYPTLAQSYQSPVINNAGGTPINFSAWTSLVATIQDPSPGPNSAAVTFGTVTGAAGGLITLQTSATDLDTVPSGSGRLVITGKPTSGDIVQLILTGTATIQPIV